MMKQSPCKGCVPPKRKLLCHSFCKEYQEFVEERTVYLEKKNAQQESAYSMNPQKRNAIRRKSRWR